MRILFEPRIQAVTVPDAPNRLVTASVFTFNAGGSYVLDEH
jgi:hypothetical protein